VDQGDKLAGIVITTDLTPTSVVTRFDLFLKKRIIRTDVKTLIIQLLF